MNPAVDFYFSKAGKWREELVQLRALLLECHLAETLKWGCPCYTFQQSNIVLIHVFKEYCALLFMKGALLKDPQGILVQQTEQVSARQVRFTGVTEITALAAVLKTYVYEAVAVEEAGLKVPLKQTAAYAVPEEFQKRLEEDPVLKAAFDALTPGRQRGYLLYFARPVQSKTRISRIEKSRQYLLEGKGLNDK
jgi:uncharacterized protein YdeI (YjbR/CyaY-like superfamily)